MLASIIPKEQQYRGNLLEKHFLVLNLFRLSFLAELEYEKDFTFPATTGVELRS